MGRARRWAALQLKVRKQQKEVNKWKRKRDRSSAALKKAGLTPSKKMAFRTDLTIAETKLSLAELELGKRKAEARVARLAI